jgi:hypothetical protein
MALFSFLKKDITENWTDYKFLELVLDLPNGKLNNVQLGREASDLQSFGKPDNNNPFDSRHFVYKDAGLIVGIDDDRITYFSFALVYDEYEELQPCIFNLIDRKGSYHEVSHKTTVPDIENILGPSKEQFELDEGQDREYSIGMFNITVQFDNEAKVVCFDICIN